MLGEADSLGFEALEEAAQKRKCATSDADGQPSPDGKKHTKGKGKNRAASFSSSKPPTGKRHVAKNAGSRSASSAPPPSADATKKCKDCKKTLPMDEFYNDQASCKACSKESKNLINMAISQGCLPWLKSLSEKEKQDLQRAVRKARLQAEKERTKLKFSLKTYRETLKSQTGQRMERRRRLMSEAQWMKHAMEEEDYTKSQAEAKWLEMMKSPRFKKEGVAPKIKIYVPIQKDLLDYDDISAFLSCDSCACSVRYVH